MINKSIGFARNLIKKREQLLHIIKKLATADDAIIITHEDGKYEVMGHTSEDAMTVYMLGTATGLSYVRAVEANADVTMNDYLNQTTGVALRLIEREGLLE